MDLDGYYVFYNDTLYRIRCETQKPQDPDKILCEFMTKFGDANCKSVLIERDGNCTVCDNYWIIISNKKRQMLDEMNARILEMTIEECRTLPIVWFVELYNGNNMIIPEADIKDKNS